MDDDDEFGDLYTDVLRPFSTARSPQPATAANPPPDLSLHSDDDEEDFVFGAPDPQLNFASQHSIQNQIRVQEPRKGVEEGEENSSRANLIGGDKGVVVEEVGRVSVKVEEAGEVSVKVEERGGLGCGNGKGVRVLEVKDEKYGIGEKNRVLMDKGGSLMGEEVEGRLEIEDDVEAVEGPMIPGLASGPFGGFDMGSNGKNVKDLNRMDSEGDDWDSDSEDDLQIVLNEKSGPMGMDGNGGMGSDEDEDGEDLVIVADGDQPHQPIEEQDWGEDTTQAGDGERKEGGDAAKANGGVGNAAGARIGYSSHGYHPHHSQFKYVRPGAAVVPAGAIAGPGGAPGQVRPLVNMGPMAGRGRADWRPIGVGPRPAIQRPFHSGYGMPVWGNNSAGRGFGGGLDFTLPSHKTVFDIDIDSFEEKPWKHPGIDVSDFFNFGLEEETWKDYCKQLEQLRLEATMQSKIRVYESGRSEQDYDPDLPPELAAATGMNDTSIENTHIGKTGTEQADMMGQGRGAARVRPPIPTGRAIQVEGGFGERLPSIDTRPPRIRDSDAIIEIVLQGGDDDPITTNDDLEQPDNDPHRDVVKGGSNEEDGEQTDYNDRFSKAFDGRKREMIGKRGPFMGSVHDNIHESDGILPFPSEGPGRNNSGPRGRAPGYSGGNFEMPQDTRWPRRTSRDRYPRPNSENDDDIIPCQSAQADEVLDNQREKSGESIGGEQNLETSSLAGIEASIDPSTEHTNNVHSEVEMVDSSAGVEGKENAKNVMIPTETVGDGSPISSMKKQKLSSRVEQPTDQDLGSGDDLRPTRSTDSKARSGSSRDSQKRRNGGEEEVVQEGRSRRLGDGKRRPYDDEHNFQRKDDYNRDGRQEMNRNRMFVKGREDSHLSYPYRERDLHSTHLSRDKPGDTERSRERDNSVGAWLKRDEDLQGRRAKDEETRKRERIDEIGSRHRSKVRESERSDKDENFHPRKRMENGEWRGHHDKDMGPRHRERDDILMIRHESHDDSHTKRRKDEEHLRREQAEKEILSGYRAREDTGRRRRERDDSLEQRRREDQPRVREKPDENHSVRHREENWRQRERDDQRLKQPHEDMQSLREREGRGALRSGRDPEDKSWVSNTRVKDDSKGLGADKEYPFKDKRRQTEHSKRSDRAEDDNSQHRGRDSVYARENQMSYEDRNPRHERSSTYNDRSSNASDNQLMPKDRHKDNRRNKESEGGDQNTLGSSKRKQEDQSTHRSEKVSKKAASERESGNAPTGPTNTRDPGQSRLSSSSALPLTNSRERDVLQRRHSSRKHREGAPSDDEQNDSRRGRSKLERWTSHKDRNESNKVLSTTSSKGKDTSKNYTDPSLGGEPPDKPSMLEFVDEQHPTGEDTSAHASEIKDTDIEPGNVQLEYDKIGEGRHLDTVEKLKKRSERFKTPMPSEKDVTTNKKIDNETFVSTQNETAVAVDAEVKPERPSRKRRW